MFTFFQRPSIFKHKKTRGLTLVWLFLMGDVFSPRDDVFILVEDALDIVLVADDDQGCQSEDNKSENKVIAWENPASQWEEENSDTSQNSNRYT